MPVAEIKTAGASANFPEFFKVCPILPPVSPEIEVAAKAFNVFIGYLGHLRVADVPNLSAAEAALVRAKQPLRKQIMENLRTIAQNFCDGPVGSAETIRSLDVERGRYDAWKERVERSLFVVQEKPTMGGNPPAPIMVPAMTDLEVRVNSGTPTDIVPPEKEKLYVALTDAMTVIGKACDRVHRENPASAVRLRDEYVRKLGGVGRVGLQDNFTSLATAALDSMKREFYTLQAGSLKKHSSEALARWSFGTSAALLVVYFLCRWFDGLGGLTASHMTREAFLQSFLYIRKEYFLLGAGAAIGTWISFMIRSLDISFDDLGKLDDEFLGPAIRVFFVLAITMTLGLVFWCGAFAISIGTMKGPADHKRWDRYVSRYIQWLKRTGPLSRAVEPRGCFR